MRRLFLERERMKKSIDYICNDLTISPRIIIFCTITNDTLWGGIALIKENKEEYKEGYRYRLGINPNGQHIMKTLKHELRHIWQWESGLLYSGCSIDRILAAEYDARRYAKQSLTFDEQYYIDKYKLEPL